MSKYDNTTVNFNFRGISELQSNITTKYATGDFVGRFYDYVSCDGGQPDYSGEGCGWMFSHTGETSDFFNGFAGSGATTGTQSLPITYNASFSPSTLNRNATTDGSFMLDLSKGTVTGHVTGVPSVSGTLNNTFLIPTDASVTPNTAVGNLNCTLSQATPITNTVQTATCTVTGIQGTNAGGFVPGYAYIGGDFPEGTTISAVGTISGASQSVTLSYLHPHGANAGVWKTTLWQGGSVTGQYISYDRNLALNGFPLIYHVYGSIDGSTLAVEGASLISSAYAVYSAPLAVTTLVKTGTTLTMQYPTSSNNYSYNGIPAIVVSGCSDGSLNGTVSGITQTTSGNHFVLTGTQAAGGTGCASANVQFPASSFAFHLYPGAEVLSPAVSAPATITLGNNDVAWASGDTLQEPHHPWFHSGTIKEFDTVNNSANDLLSTGAQLYGTGAGIAGAYTFLTMSNLNPCSMYVGCGGFLPAPTMMHFGGYSTKSTYKTGLRVDEMPVAGGSVISMGCADTALGGCSSTEPFNIVTSDFGPKISLTPADDMWNFTNGIHAANIIGDNEIQANGGLGISNKSAGTIALRFLNIDLTEISRIQAETRFGGNSNLGVGQIDGDNHASVLYTARGGFDVGNITASSGALLNATQVGITAPVISPVAVYTGAVGSVPAFGYQFTALTPDGLETPYGNNSILLNNTAPLGGGNYVTITCPAAIQYGWPAGTTLRLYKYLSGVHYIGACPYGTTVVDDGSAGVVTGPPIYNATANLLAGSVTLGLGGWMSALPATNSLVADAYFGRGAAGTWDFGTTKGAHDGTVRAATGTFGTAVTVAGQNVCRADGTNCPAASTIPKGRATLAAGTVTVSSTAASTSAIYSLTNCSVGGTQGMLSVGTVTAGTSFVINSNNPADTSTVCWAILP